MNQTIVDEFQHCKGKIDPIAYMQDPYLTQGIREKEITGTNRHSFGKINPFLNTMCLLKNM